MFCKRNTPGAATPGAVDLLTASSQKELQMHHIPADLLAQFVLERRHRVRPQISRHIAALAGLGGVNA